MDERAEQDHTFPCPRTWAFASELLPGLTNGLALPLLTGAVGEGAAAQFIAFRQIASQLPSPDAVILDPTGSPIPDEPAALYAISTALAGKASDQNFDAVVAYANRLPDEFSVLLVRDATRRTPDVQNTRAFTEWVSQHGEVMQ
jgi:hypothetical protein